MELKDLIREWLNGPRDYQEGLKLLMKAIKKPRKKIIRLQNWQARDESSKVFIIYHKKLVYELSQLIKSTEIPVSNEDTDVPGSITIHGIDSNESDRQRFIRRQLPNF